MMDPKKEKEILKYLYSKMGKGILPLGLLRVIKVKGPIHAYDLVKIVNTGFHQIKDDMSETEIESIEDLKISRALIYSTLHNLEKQGFVESTWVSQDDIGAPSKKNYLITESGELILKHAKEKMRDIWNRIFDSDF